MARCKHVNVKGRRKGERCNRYCKGDYCAPHSSSTPYTEGSIKPIQLKLFIKEP